MRFHFAGKYDGNEMSLPQREHPENAVAFKEPDMKKLALIANIGAIVLLAVLSVPYVLRGYQYIHGYMWLPVIGSILVLVPHEFLHALCFKEDVYMYDNLKQGLLFVVGTEDMSKSRFILMSLCPNIVFGLIPFMIFLIFPTLSDLGLFGILCLAMGFGDYMNVYHALTQMPSHARTYLCGMHSYWYIPEEK